MIPFIRHSEILYLENKGVTELKQLFSIDLQDYKDTYKVFRRPSARAIIFKDNKIALVYSKKEKYFKFPGGGIHDDEDKRKAEWKKIQSLNRKTSITSVMWKREW